MKTPNPTSSSAQAENTGHSAKLGSTLQIKCPFCETIGGELRSTHPITTLEYFWCCVACGAQGPKRATLTAAISHVRQHAVETRPTIPNPDQPCCYCGKLGHIEESCPRVSAIEFHESGHRKRVEFVTPAQLITQAQPALLHPYPQPQRSGLLVPAHGIATATSSDDSPAPTDERPWPKVTWAAYDDAGRLDRADIQTPDGQLVTVIVPGDGQFKTNFFIRSTISSEAGAILEVMVADRDGKEHGWFKRSTAAQKP